MIRSYQSPVAAGTVSKVMMMQLLSVVKDSVCTGTYRAKGLLTALSLSLSLSLSSCTQYVLVQYSMYYTSTYRNFAGKAYPRFLYKGADRLIPPNDQKSGKNIKKYPQNDHFLQPLYKGDV